MKSFIALSSNTMTVGVSSNQLLHMMFVGEKVGSAKSISAPGEYAVNSRDLHRCEFGTIRRNAEGVQEVLL